MLKREFSKMSLWGVIRFPPRDGGDETDKAVFDGWVINRFEAVRTYTEWCRKFPRENVAIVKQADYHAANEASLVPSLINGV